MTRSLPIIILALGASACTAMGTPTEPTPTPKNTVNYTAIGASDAIGYGSSAPCLPFVACPDGKGYVQLLERRLRSGGKTVTLLNLGLPGGVLSSEIQTIGNRVGRDILSNFLDSQVPFVATDSTLVTVFAGGNDVNTIGAALEAGQGGSDPAGYLATRRQAFGRDLRAMMSGIKGRAPSARVVVLNLPNLAGMPYAAGFSLQRRRTLQEISVAFSAEMNKLTAEGAIVVDLMCDGSFYQSSIYSSDGFHPNDAGYARMADVTYPAASTGAAIAPRASCSQMALY